MEKLFNLPGEKTREHISAYCHANAVVAKRGDKFLITSIGHKKKLNKN